MPVELMDENGITDRGDARAIKDGINGARDKALGWSWRKIVAFGGSGFGKGALITAALTVGVLAAWAMFKSTVPEAYHTLEYGNFSLTGQQPLSVGEALKAGVNEAFHFLSHIPGMLVMGLGGTIGLLNEVRHQNEEMSRDMAETRALLRAQEKVRSAPQCNVEQGCNAQDRPRKSYAQIERERMKARENINRKEGGLGYGRC